MHLIRAIKRTVFHLMMVPAANRLVFRLRFLWYVYVVKQLRVYGEDGSVLVPDYSLKMLKRGKTSDRPLHLIRPLSVILNRSTTTLNTSTKILSIGCRFETELLYLVGYGFSPQNIRGFDMLSYSPWVDCGNMHALPYADNSWDAVILGWVLSYSDNPKKAKDEVVRVACNGALIAIGVSYYPAHMMTEEYLAAGEVRLRDQRIQTVEGFLRLFGDHVQTVYFQHDAPDPAKEGFCSVIFSIKK